MTANILDLLTGEFEFLKSYNGCVPNFLEAVKLGLIPGFSIVDRIGAVEDVGTTLTPLANASVYRTPSSLTSLELVSTDNTNDVAAGNGARKVRVAGLSTGWAETYEDVTLNGTTAVALTKQFYRVYDMYLLEAGTYGSQDAPSHNSTITLRESGAGQTWATIVSEDGFGLGESLIAAYTSAKNTQMFFLFDHNTVQTGKDISKLRFIREQADTVAAPYAPVKVQEIDRGLTTAEGINFRAFEGPYIGPCDIGYLVKASSLSVTCNVAITFSLLIIES